MIDDSSGKDDAVLRLCQDSAVGGAIFSGRIRGILTDRVAAVIASYLETHVLTGNEPLTGEAVDTIRRDLLRKIQAIPGAENIEPKRKISVKYRSSQLEKVEVSSIAQEVNIRLWAMIKSCAIASKQLAPLQAECLLDYQDAIRTTRPIPTATLNKVSC